MKQVIVFPRGQLSAADRRALVKAGVCPVEADDPQKVVCALPGAPLVGGDDILCAALEALANFRTQSEAHATFVAALNRLVKISHPPA